MAARHPYLGMLERYFAGLFGSGERKRALLVDGPNMLRGDVDVHLEEVRGVVDGKLHVARAYLNHQAPPSLVEAVETNGLEVVVTSSDVDVRLAVDATYLALEGMDLFLVTRDADFKPVLERANEVGVRTVVIGVSMGFSSALESVADEVFLLD